MYTPHALLLNVLTFTWRLGVVLLIPPENTKRRVLNALASLRSSKTRDDPFTRLALFALGLGLPTVLVAEDRDPVARELEAVARNAGDGNAMGIDFTVLRGSDGDPNDAESNLGRLIRRLSVAVAAMGATNEEPRVGASEP